MGGEGGRAEVGGEAFSSPTCFFLREPLLEVHGERRVCVCVEWRGAMVMQQLMEISCWDLVSV